MTLAKYGIVLGSDGFFFPDDSITRAQLIKIIILSFGLYDETAECVFFDVPKESWHYPFVASAKKHSVTSGITEDYFGPDEFVTREQLITLAYNAAVKAGIVFDKKGEIHFNDIENAEPYALKAVNALAEGGIISGDQSLMLNPKNYASRAEACKIIYSISLKTIDNF